MEFSRFVYRFNIVVQTKLYHFSPSGFYFKPATPQHRNSTHPQNHKYKNMAQRNAHSRSEFATLSRVRSVQNRNSRTCKLQSLSQIRTLCQASSKIAFGRPSGLNFPICFAVRSTFFRLKNLLNFGTLQNAPKSQKTNLGTILAPILIICWIPSDINFTYI